jgi:hypothetical protein
MSFDLSLGWFALVVVVVVVVSCSVRKELG